LRDEIYDLFLDDDPVVAMRASYVAMKLAQTDPSTAQEFKELTILLGAGTEKGFGIVDDEVVGQTRNCSFSCGSHFATEWKTADGVAWLCRECANLNGLGCP